ncbi:MAG: glutathione S-transferase family protein [Pseudomonadota bacterium]
MKLIGRNLSPYTRKVAIWCALQGRTIDREELATTDPAAMEALAAYHPGVRVPALVLDDGDVLVDSAAICDFLDDTGSPRLVPETGLARRQCLKVMGLAHATTEKIVALVYEKDRRPEAYVWDDWIARLTRQVSGGLDALEAAATGDFFGGDAPNGADIATVCAYQMAEVTQPFILEKGYPHLSALADRAMAIAVFETTYPSVG